MEYRRIVREGAVAAIDRAGLVAAAALRQAGTPTARIAGTLAARPARRGTTGALVAIFTGREPDAAGTLSGSFNPSRARRR